jgi:hypothetical protein
MCSGLVAAYFHSLQVDSMLETHWLSADGLNFVAVTKTVYLEIASVTPVSSNLREIAWRQRYPNVNQVVIHNVGVYQALSGKERSLESHILEY